jgi:hypothetical protein
VQDLIHHLIGRFVRVFVGAASTASEALLTEFAIPIPPQVEGRSCNPKVSAGLVDVPDALGVLKDSLWLDHRVPSGAVESSMALAEPHQVVPRKCLRNHESGFACSVL